MTARRVAVSAACLVLAAGVMVAALTRSVGFADTATVAFTGETDVVTIADFGERGSHILQYAHGAELTISFPLENTSPMAVTVADVRFDHQPRSLLVPEQIRAGDEELPRAVAPGESMVITLRTRFDNCRFYHEREVQLISAVVVDGRTVGIPVRRRVALDHDLVIHSPMIVDCPDRTLDRTDDPRPRS